MSFYYFRAFANQPYLLALLGPDKFYFAGTTLLPNNYPSHVFLLKYCPLEFVVSPTSIIAPYYGSVFTINAWHKGANEPISFLVSTPPWIHPSITYGFTPQAFTVLIEKKPSVKRRTGTILLTTTYPKYATPKNSSLQVRQSGAGPILLPPPGINPPAEPFNQQVESNMEAIPEAFTLQQNYPNPFNPSTTIAFSLPEPAQVQMTLYDLQGKQIASIFDTSLPAGNHQLFWTAADAQGNPLPSGTYIYTLQAGSFRTSKKMTIIK